MTANASIAHVVQTFPEPATRSDLMPNFVKGYLGKKYGVHTLKYVKG